MLVESNCCSVSAAGNQAQQPVQRQLPIQAEFEVKKCLGRGAQASVYQACLGNNAQVVEAERQQTFAIKVFEGPLQSKTDIASEVHVHQLLNGHENIMPIMGYIEKEATIQVPRSIPRSENDQFAKWRQGHESITGKPVIVFEECRYGDLFNFVGAHGSIRDPKLLKYLFLQVCHGLHALHTEANLAHLDIKLENILVSNDGVLKLCDFGMVQSIESNVAKRMGTEMYMAPEVQNKGMDSTYKGVPADIFGMGVLLWILQFGAPPFNDTSAHDRNYNVLQRNADSYWRLHPCVRKWGEPIDEDFKSLLTSMLSADISKRPASIADVIQHPFFTKEDDLLDAAINQWTDSEALKTQFKAKLAELLDQNAANSED